MTNIDLLKQYVDTGVGIPRYQFDKLPNNLKQTYIRKIGMIYNTNPEMIHGFNGLLPLSVQMDIVKNNIEDYDFIEDPDPDVDEYVISYYEDRENKYYNDEVNRG